MIEDALDTLPEKHKKAYLLYYPIDGSTPLTYQEIHEKTGIPLGTLSYLITKSTKTIEDKIHQKPNSSIPKKGRKKRTENALNEKTIENIEKERLPVAESATEESAKEEIMRKSKLSDIQKLKLKPLIKMLNNEEQEIIVLLSLGYIRDKQYSIEEIATFLKIKEVDVGTILHYALMKMSEFGESFSGSSKEINEIISEKDKKRK